MQKLNLVQFFSFFFLFSLCTVYYIVTLYRQWSKHKRNGLNQCLCFPWRLFSTRWFILSLAFALVVECCALGVFGFESLTCMGSVWSVFPGYYSNSCLLSFYTSHLLVDYNFKNKRFSLSQLVHYCDWWTCKWTCWVFIFLNSLKIGPHTWFYSSYYIKYRLNPKASPEYLSATHTHSQVVPVIAGVHVMSCWPATTWSWTLV